MPLLDKNTLLNQTLNKLNSLLNILIPHVKAIILNREVDLEALEHMNSLLLVGLKNCYRISLNNISSGDPRETFLKNERELVSEIYRLINNYRHSNTEELSNLVRQLENLIDNRNRVSHSNVVAKTVDKFVRKSLLGHKPN